MATKGKIFTRCTHEKVKIVSNGDWEWFECIKCGKRIEDNQNDYYEAKGK